MTEIATINWFERWGTSVFSENTAIFRINYCLSEVLERLGGRAWVFKIKAICMSNIMHMSVIKENYWLTLI